MDKSKKILEILYLEPNRKFHIRLLARFSKLHPNTVMTITDELVKEKLVLKKSDVDTNRVIIKANHNLKFKLRKLFYNLDKIYTSGLVDYLNYELAFPVIILFGSCAKAENDKNSDLDLFIISEDKKKLNLAKFEKKLGVPIQIFLHTKKEFKKLQKTSPELINNVLNGEILSGYLEVF